MSLKHLDIRPYLFFILAVLFLHTALYLNSYRNLADVTETETEFSSTEEATEFCTTEVCTEYATAETETLLFNPAQVVDEKMSEATSEAETEHSLPHPHNRYFSIFFTVLMYFLFAAGAIFSILFLCLPLQKRPLLGPELDFILLFTIINTPTLWNAFAFLLISLRGLLGWFFQKCDAKWSFSHRLGSLLSQGSPRPVPYLFSHILFCLLDTAAAILLLCSSSRQILASAFFAALIPSFFSLVHYAGNIGSMQASHEEALRTAITSERFKVELIANVSHDLRTPLTSILGYGELLRQETLSPTGQEQLRALNQKAGYMKDLVESLFELTKVQSGVIEPQKASLDLIRLLEQTLGLFDDELNQASLTVRRHYEITSLPVMSDGALLHQVFANLLGNAIKYALPGTRVHLEVREQETACTIRLTNTSSYEMNFQPEEILQRFARGDKARTTKGSGIGLAIAKTYTEAVGGQFQITIDYDQFSAIVTLPKSTSQY